MKKISASLLMLSLLTSISSSYAVERDIWVQKSESSRSKLTTGEPGDNPGIILQQADRLSFNSQSDLPGFYPPGPSLAGAVIIENSQQLSSDQLALNNDSEFDHLSFNPQPDPPGLYPPGPTLAGTVIIENSQAMPLNVIA